MAEAAITSKGQITIPAEISARPTLYLFQYQSP